MHDMLTSVIAKENVNGIGNAQKSSFKFHNFFTNEAL
jgi:hypothetical protein